MRRADHSSRGVLPTVLRRCVCDLETSRTGAPYIYDISRLRVNSVFENEFSERSRLPKAMRG